MKKVLFILIVTPLLLSGRRSSDVVMQAGVLPACLTKGEAERILGQAAILSDGSSGETDRIVHHKCTFTAMAKDTKSDKTGAVYYRRNSIVCRVSTQVVCCNRHEQCEHAGAEHPARCWG